MNDRHRLAILALLESMEWSGDGAYSDGEPYSKCPLCKARKSNGHYDGCDLAAAIKVLREPAGEHKEGE